MLEVLAEVVIDVPFHDWTEKGFWSHRYQLPETDINSWEIYERPTKEKAGILRIVVQLGLQRANVSKHG